MPFSHEVPERRTTHGPGPETKGGGFKGGPKRWTGRGPAPARHIPWPEIFKHHISVVEGHLKMIDMVRKHTVKGSANWSLINGCIERAQTMMHDSKAAAKNFVPPPKQRDQVPIGVSSASMYPGYSPADHEYGKAAQEFGSYAAQSKKHGEEPDIHGEYELGQSRGARRQTSANPQGSYDRKRGRDSAGSAHASGSNATNVRPRHGPLTNGNSADAGVSGDDDAGNPYFVIDTQPMKVTRDKAGNIIESSTDGASNHKSKKVKQDHEGDLPTGDHAFEDITDATETRLKEKEEKKSKKKSKRKRDSTTAADDSPAAKPATPSKDEESAPKKKKQKSKHKQNETTDAVNGQDKTKRKPEVDGPNGAKPDKKASKKDKEKTHKKRKVDTDA